MSVVNIRQKRSIRDLGIVCDIAETFHREARDIRGPSYLFADNWNIEELEAIVMHKKKLKRERQGGACQSEGHAIPERLLGSS